MSKITQDHQRYLAGNLGKAIQWALENWEQSVQHVLNLNAKIRSTWTWQGIAAQYIQLFEELIAAKPR